MTKNDVTLTRTDPFRRERGPQADTWYVIWKGAYIGRVRKTDGEWNGSYWHLHSKFSREMTSLGGSWRKRDGAVAGVVGAWVEQGGQP